MIKDTFTKYGDTFTCVSLSGDYRVYRRETPKSDTSVGHVQYEIIKPVKIGGEWRYPGSSFWGIYGWTCTDEKQVVKKMAKLMEKSQHNNK